MSQSGGVPASAAATLPVEATAAQSNVASANADTALLAVNAARRGASVFNDSTSILNISFGAGAASATNFKVQVAPGGYWSLGADFAVWTGAIRGWWATANGFARVTELTA